MATSTATALGVGVLAGAPAGGLATGTISVEAAAVPPVRDLPAEASVARTAVRPVAGFSRNVSSGVRASRSASRLVAYDRQPKAVARAMMAQRYGWGARQFRCLSTLWERESSWEVQARNSSSGAYGIPQALPARKMSAYGSNYRTSARTQIRWGLAYIRSTYRTPCAALSSSRTRGWY